ncbi:hypothetical protein [Kitasatospora sp. CB01950]|uniref:hypothetical protein n=1 Tax=Kitasatospora sp. CB01950 TaxID=1703930 RepID=UPI0011613CCE|nr:hypothetical protein [Kitasatospora sp. CB01950]
MRTNHAKRPRRSDTPRHRWGRHRALAASGMLAVQLLGLAIGTADAHATGLDPTTRALVAPVDGNDLLDGAIGELGTVLQQHLGSGELPLPGQHSGGPDAFAIAARLLSAVPGQDRPDDAGRASRSNPAEGRPGDRVAPIPAPDEPAPDPATPLPSRRHVDNLTTTPERPAPPPAAPDHGAPLALTAAAPATPDDDSTAAVLLPIAAGLLLTAAAAYKHRGLPGGH